MTCWEPGDTVANRYILGGVLGRGAFSSVYRASDMRLGREVALKVYHAPDPRFEEFVRREAALLARLNEPHIEKIFDYFVEGDATVLVLQLLRGRTLAEWLREKHPDDTDALLEVVLQVAQALQVLHRSDIVHRDVKPSNIFIGVDGTTVLMDFGIAVPSASTDLIRTGAVFGTPRYMSPEQVRGDAVDARSDLYSLGVVLFEVLAGRPPFTDTSPSEVLVQHTSAPPPPLHEFAPTVSLELAEVVRRALSKDPRDRYQSADELVRALTAVRHAAPLRTPFVYQAALGGRTVAPVAGASPRLRLRWLLATLGVVLLLALVLLVIRISGDLVGVANLVPNLIAPWLIRALVALILLAAGALVFLAKRRPPRHAPVPERDDHDQTFVGVRSADLTQLHNRDSANANGLAWLLVLSGDQRGQHIRLTGNDTIGRAISGDVGSIPQVRFADRLISRQHARVVFVDGEFRIDDLGSVNGTRVNGVMPSARQVLHDRDEIVVGDTVMSFVLGATNSGLGYDSQRRLDEFDAIWDALVGSGSDN